MGLLDYVVALFWVFWGTSSCFPGFPGGSDDKESTYSSGDLGSIPGLGRSLEKGMATHYSILAWIIPWTEEPGGPHSKWLQSDMTEWVTSLSYSIFPSSCTNLHSKPHAVCLWVWKPPYKCTNGNKNQWKFAVLRDILHDNETFIKSCVLVYCLILCCLCH